MALGKALGAHSGGQARRSLDLLALSTGHAGIQAPLAAGQLAFVDTMGMVTIDQDTSIKKHGYGIDEAYQAALNVREQMLQKKEKKWKNREFSVQ